MRLKRLNIKGFKSFADETEVHFNENLIGIVGPNGSGKSNIVDSIRWVLGEQKTTELRLENMTDVIFNGSKARKEGKIARVSLTFENTKNLLPTDYNEVSIGRVLYRDGTSEYLLNNVSCRRKDITNLFIDSGIGSNSYAIISLNMVEDILHDNGGYRRAMIEQAAGIAKYKIRKKETALKLKGTEEDLDRIEDILHEIKKNMTSFERQAKRTEKYNNLKAEYRQITLRLSKQECKQIIAQIQELSKLSEIEKLNRIKVNTASLEKDATLQQLKLEIVESEKMLSTDQQAYNQLIEVLSSRENAKNLTLQTIQSSKDFLKDLGKNRIELTLSESNAIKHLAQSEQNIAELAAQLDTKKKRLTDISNQLNVSNQLLGDLRKRERELINQINANQSLKNSLTRDLESLRAKKNLFIADIEELKKKESQTNDELSILQKQLKSAESEVEKADKQLKKIQEQVVESQNRLEVALEELNGSKKRYSQLELDLSSVDQRIRFMSNIIEKNEGVPEAVKFALQSGKSSKPQLLSDIISVKDEAYTKIIEFFLEPYIHYVVVENAASAFALTDIVRKGQKGKLHQYILDEIPESSIIQRYGLIPIIDLLKVDRGMLNLVKWLLRDVYIATERYADFDKTKLDGNITVLFHEDYLIVSQAKLYGGSSTLFEGAQLGRKQMLEKLEAEKLKTLATIEKQQERINHIQTKYADTQSLLTTNRNSEMQGRQSLENLNRQLYQTKSQCTNTQQNLAYLSHQIVEKSGLLSQVVADLEVQQKRFEEIEAHQVEELRDDALSQKIEQVSLDNLKIGQEKDKAQRDLYEWQSKYDLALKDQQYYKNTIDTIVERLKRLDSDQELHQSKLVQAESNLQTISEELNTLYTKKKEIQYQLSDKEDNYYKRKGDIFELEKELSVFRADLHQLDDKILLTTENLNKLRFELQSIKDRTLIEFGVNIDELQSADQDIEESDDETMDYVEAKRIREQLREKIHNFGDINPLAITAYNEIKERYEQIDRERNDVLEAKKTLLETMGEIEETASGLFNEALRQIRENFQMVFQGLFSEDDSCDIVLLDNENPLDAKVEIIAKPKGKKPKTISQLSGGEKTLTAASFLFALYLLKPAPFCIFDEVDAPLDDVNIQKFNKIIRQFSKDSQFIVITHNKLTMAEVDVLYGVFLKEQGVSGLSAVDFRSYEAAEILTSDN